MLKKGQVYKATYDVDVDESYAQRNNMIISPAEDVDVRKIFNKQMSLVKCLFHIKRVVCCPFRKQQLFINFYCY